MMNKRQLSICQNEKFWFNLFNKYVLLQVDEKIFKSLYHDRFGAPNALVNVLVCMQQIKEGRWRIELSEEDCKHRYVYFSKENHEDSLRRQIYAHVLQEELNKRNNVEATMFQLSFHARNNQTRYRGLASNRLMAYNRCAWMNFERLANYFIA
jgi:hypothetical protein